MSQPVTFVWPGDLHLDHRGRDNHSIALWMADEVSALIRPDFVQFAGDNVQHARDEEFALFDGRVVVTHQRVPRHRETRRDGKVNEKVQLMEGTREVLGGITRVIESAKSQGNNLLVLSNSARIEGIAQYRMEYVAKHADLKPHELSNATQFDYARKAEALQRDCSDVENRLKEVSLYMRSIGADSRVQFVTLDDQPQGNAHPFLRYLGKVLNEHVLVESYRPGSNSALPQSEGVPHHKRFLVPDTTGTMDNAQAHLVQHLYESQGQAIREMQELGIRVTRIAKTLPVQLFISAPAENKPGIYKGLCVVILGSGSSTSGRATKLTAFLPDDPHIVASMMELFYDYENDAQVTTREFARPVLTS